MRIGLIHHSRLYKKGEFEAAIENYKKSLMYCPLDDSYNKERVSFLFLHNRV